MTGSGCFQFKNAANHQGRGHYAGQRALGVGRLHAGHVDGGVLQTVEEHRVVRPRAPPDGHAAVRHVGGAAGPVADAGRREHRSRLLPVRTPMGTAVGLQGWGVEIFMTSKLDPFT